MKTRLKKLRDQRAALVQDANAAAEAAIARAEAGGGSLTPEEEQAQEEYNSRIAALDTQIRLAEQAIERQASSASPILDAGPVDTPPGPALTGRIQVGPTNVTQDPMRGFRDTGDFARSVQRACSPMGQVDARLIEAGLVGGLRAAPTNYHQESGTPEGAMVPPAISQAIWQLVFDDPLLSLISVEPTDRPSVEILADETTPWGASGVTAAWRSEGVQMTPSKLDTKTKQVRLNELYAFVLATGELLEDVPRLTERLNVKAPAAIRYKFVEALMFGTGAGQPLGWAADNYAGKILHARTTSGQIKPDDLVKMFSRLLLQDGADRSFWVTNRDTVPDLILRSVVGNVPVWMPGPSLAGAPHGTILGRPLFFSEHCQTLGTAGDIQLINPDGYYATQRGPARQDSSMHLYFDYNITAFRWMFRFGGYPLLSAAVSPAKGASTKSHFIILNT